MVKSKLFVAACAATCVISGAARPAFAEHLLTSVFAPEQLFTTPGLAKIFPSGSFTQSIFLTTPSTVMINFSAVCSTSGAGFKFTSVQILVDGKRLYPTNQSGNVLCGTGGNETAADGLATNSFISTATLGAGNHNLNVNVVPTSGATSRLKNLALTIWR